MEAPQVTYTPQQSVPSMKLGSISLTQSYLVSFILILLTFTILYSSRKSGPKLPGFNPRTIFEFTDSRRLHRFMENSIEQLMKAKAKFGKNPYKLFCDWGELIVLPLDSVDDIRSDRRFDFSISASDDAHSYAPGFRPLDHNPALPTFVSKYLTKALTKLTSPLSEEATLALRHTIGDSTDWHEMNVKVDIMSIVSRMSSRVFMGEELCRDVEWNNASSFYTLKAFIAIDRLRQYPRWMRPIVHWFLPCCWEVRRALSNARKALEPHLQHRRQIKAERLASGDKSQFDDSIEWMEQAGSTMDAASGQISLSVVAIHTTSDLLQQTIVNIAMHPELFQPLREEVINVLSREGLKKTALYNLKLMDSVIKESQRLKPIFLGWKRMALEDVTLPNGLNIQKGTKIVVDQTHMWHSDYYSDAEKFDGYRFMRMRDTPGQDHLAHLVSTSQNHLGFGHGVHACPGRFFASNEIKIALCHLILKYDWKMIEGTQTKPIAHGMSYGGNPTTKLLIRRRKEEMDFASLES